MHSMPICILFVLCWQRDQDGKANWMKKKSVWQVSRSEQLLPRVQQYKLHTIETTRLEGTTKCRPWRSHLAAPGGASADMTERTSHGEEEAFTLSLLVLVLAQTTRCICLVKVPLLVPHPSPWTAMYEYCLLVHPRED
ncbi:hypothetical protein V8C44DRAFT_104655 [Trichoderma aethiopicum]